MTPKEKAIELVTKYYGHFNAHMSLAKKCALIAVNEIIEATNMYQFAISNDKESIPAKVVNHPYWQEVKQEIEKL